MDKFLANYLKIDQENIAAAEKKAREARRKPVPALQRKYLYSVRCGKDIFCTFSNALVNTVVRHFTLYRQSTL